MEKVREKNKHKSKRYYGKPETEIPYFRDLGSKDDEGVRDIIVGRRCTETSACDRVEESIAPCGGKTDPSANVGAGKAPENTTESESAASATVAEAVNAEKSDGETAHAETDTAKSDGEMEKPECEDNGFAFNIMFRYHAEDADPYRDRKTFLLALDLFRRTSAPSYLWCDQCFGWRDNRILASDPDRVYPVDDGQFL